MELENLHGQMVVFIEENGKIVENMEMASLWGLMEPFMKVNGKMADIMAKED